MSLLARLAPHLPYVRRYARALTGDQATGDNYVRVALEALAAGELQLSPEMTPRVALYHVFHAIWATTGARLEDMSGIRGREDDATRRLMRIAPRSRQAFLLTALEGFTPSEAAQILDADPRDVDRLIADAQTDIDTELATDVLIIEDEAIISADIESLVKELGHRVTGTATTHAEAVDAVARHRPGLVLADIQLADGSSGIDAVKEILKQIDVPVIFITAFPERLLTGERPEPTFLITKPFQPETVKAAISQALFFHPGSPESGGVKPPVGPGCGPVSTPGRTLAVRLFPCIGWTAGRALQTMRVHKENPRKTRRWPWLA
jgi:CheY-like chemotaxis protein